MNWKLDLALISCALLGLRHGFDYDHLAAISDITAVQTSWKQGMRLGITYALGHALTVVTLGALVVMLHVPLPARLDNWTERLAGSLILPSGAQHRQHSPANHWRSGMLVRPRDLADRMSGPQRPTIFTLPMEAARLKAREVLDQFPQAGYATVVENWRQLPDGQIEFTMRHLPTAD